MTDVFADFVTDEWLDRIFAVMALCPQHVFQVLTKRPERMRRYFSGIQNGAAHHPRAILARRPDRRSLAI
jgi:protein gp37